jgi:hypothetical protein
VPQKKKKGTRNEEFGPSAAARANDRLTEPRGACYSAGGIHVVRRRAIRMGLLLVLAAR